MNQPDDVNSLDSVSISAQQATLLGEALLEYEGPEMHWEDGETDEDFRNELADEVRARLERRLMQNGFTGSAVAFTEQEYRVAVEALVQYKRETGDARASELIGHLQWFTES